MGYEKIDENIRLYVRDTGIGIPEDKKDKVFHRFEKLDEFAQEPDWDCPFVKPLLRLAEER